nr:transposase and inactivated derivatives [Bradyrhizobium sp. DOA9]
MNIETRCFKKPEARDEETEVQSRVQGQAVKLVRERGVSAAQVGRDHDVHKNVLRKWVKELAPTRHKLFLAMGRWSRSSSRRSSGCAVRSLS